MASSTDVLRSSLLGICSSRIHVGGLIGVGFHLQVALESGTVHVAFLAHHLLWRYGQICVQEQRQWLVKQGRSQ